MVHESVPHMSHTRRCLASHLFGSSPAADAARAQASTRHRIHSQGLDHPKANRERIRISRQIGFASPQVIETWSGSGAPPPQPPRWHLPWRKERHFASLDRSGKQRNMALDSRNQKFGSSWLREGVEQLAPSLPTTRPQHFAPSSNADGPNFAQRCLLITPPMSGGLAGYMI